MLRMQILIKLIVSDRVGESNKRMLRLEDIGIAGLTSLFEPLGAGGEDSLCLDLLDIILLPGIVSPTPWSE